MTPIDRLIRALRRFNADNIALWEAFIRVQRPWEAREDGTPATAGQEPATAAPENSGSATRGARSTALGV